MSTIINTYPVFEGSQVLTSAQLNQLISYLDQQNRLTRVKLIGMGIVCGLELTYDDSAQVSVTISRGTAISSEGFLLSLGECKTRYYRPYILPQGVEYKPFGFPEQDVTLFELLRELPDDDTDVESLNAGFLSDKFVLLFLECYDNDLRSCLGRTCDDLGIDRVFTLRKLVIGKNDLNKVLTRSGNVKEVYPDKFTLPDIVIPRVLFNPSHLHSEDYAEFSKNYINAFRNVYETLLGSGSAGALSRTYLTYEPLLGPAYKFANPFNAAAIQTLRNSWDNFIAGTSSPGPVHLGIQYFYDFIKDVVLAYNEFRECAFELMSQCCPDMSLFPKHVMLGRAINSLETKEEARTYRHRFTQPPIYNQQKYLTERAISLHKRLVLMLEQFNLSRINNPAGESSLQVRITPSFEKSTSVSDRSIPYYYKSKETSAIIPADTLEYCWNFDHARKKLHPAQPLILGYENQRSDQTTPGSHAETPLFYDLDSYPFLRIEGHIGKNANDVMNELLQLKSDFNLSFDIVAVQLDRAASALPPDYNCGFEDIQEEYVVHGNVFCSFVSDIVELYEFFEKNMDKDEEDSISEEDLDKIRVIKEKLEELCAFIKPCLHDFDFVEFQKTYKNLLQDIIDFILVDKISKDIEIDEESVESLSLINGGIQRISPLIYRVIDLLFYTKFYRLYYAFKRREIFLTKSVAFATYIEKHPGAAHQAGVYHGNTFVLLYNNSVERKVIGDFTLPYQCCAVDHCVPMCGDKEAIVKLPPFARPDYAITVVDTPVIINVKINDYGMSESEYKIQHSEVSSEGGRIRPAEEAGVLEYTPMEGFVGIDTFAYDLIDMGTGESDTGRVTILVKEPHVAEACYDREVLLCWGIDQVRAALLSRDIENRNMSDDEAVEALLDSLRETNGFTDEDFSRTPLESDDGRRELLKCIGVSGDFSYDEVAERIKEYQNENCGGAVSGPCTVTKILGHVHTADGQPLAGANITVRGTTSGTTSGPEGRFSLDLGAPGQTIEVSAIGFVTEEVRICNEQEVTIVLTENSQMKVDFELLDDRSLLAIVKSRDIEVPEPDDRRNIIDTIMSSDKSNELSRSELRLLTNDTLRVILDAHGIRHLASDNKDQLVDRIFGK